MELNGTLTERVKLSRVADNLGTLPVLSGPGSRTGDLQERDRERDSRDT